MVQILWVLALAGAAAVVLYSSWQVLIAYEVLKRGAGSFLVPLLTGVVLSILGSWLALIDRVLPWFQGRRDQVSPAPLRMLIYIPFAGGLFHLLVMPPGHAGYFYASLTLVCGAIGVDAMLHDIFDRVVPARLRKGIDLLFVALIACAVLGELGLRLMARFRPSPIFAGVYSPAECVSLTRRPAGELFFGVPLNSRGYNDREPEPRAPARRLVISIADAYSLGAVPHELHYTSVCERALPGVDVYNMGMPGIGPPEYLHLLSEETLPLRPDAIVLCLVVGSDLAEWCDSSDYGSFWLNRNNMLLYKVPRRLFHAEERRYAEELEERSLFKTQEPMTLSEARERAPWLSDPLIEPPTLSRQAYLGIETQRALGVCGNQRACFDQLIGLLGRMKEVSPAPLYALLIPDEFQVEEVLWTEIKARARGQGLDRDRPQRELREILDRQEIAYLDLLPVMRAVPPLSDGRRHLYKRQDTHWNTHGNEVAGTALGAFLEPMLRAKP